MNLQARVPTTIRNLMIIDQINERKNVKVYNYLNKKEQTTETIL